jgi:hypothetical protein
MEFIGEIIGQFFGEIIFGSILKILYVLILRPILILLGLIGFCVEKLIKKETKPFDETPFDDLEKMGGDFLVGSFVTLIIVGIVSMIVALVVYAF